MNRDKVLEYFGGDELATDVWIDKYRLEDENTPNDTIDRLAKEFYRVETRYKNALTYQEIRDYLNKFKFIIPAGSPLLGIGNNKMLTSLSNCYVVASPVDSYAGILKSDEELVQLMKRRGGVGLDISTIRPYGTTVNNAARTSTGIIPFMDRYSNTTKEVAQEGRRGALIITINVNHPDIERFIVSKDDLTKITGANISIKVDNLFMKAVEEDGTYELYHPSFKDSKGIVVQARKIWNKLVFQAWKSAEPGLLFWDKVVSESPADCYKGFHTESTNPCGELPLCPYDSCRLMHINIFSFVKNPFTKESSFNWGAYLKCVNAAQRLMDDMVDLEQEKIEAIIVKVKNRDTEDKELKSREIELWNKIREKLIFGRRTGLNPWLGLADTLAALGIKYDTDAAIHFAEDVAKRASVEAYKCSIQLAKERGHFPVWDRLKEANSPFIKRILFHLDEESIETYEAFGRRNISCLTIPPSGSVAILSQVSSGIEPVFNLSYIRKRRTNEDNPNKKFKDANGEWWEEYEVYHPRYKDWLTIAKHIQSYSNEKINNPYDGATTNEIDPIQKVKLQGAMQRWIDHSISVTHNLPKTCTVEDVSNIYFQAWKEGCKGITVYREGSRDAVLKTHRNEFKQHDAPKRPKVLPHDVYSVMSKGHHWIVSVGIFDGKPYEVFVFNNVDPFNGKLHGEVVKIGKGRYDLKLPSIHKIYAYINGNTSDEENLLTRMISTSLRHGADIKFVVDQLNKSEGDITSFGKAVARVLRKYVPDGFAKEGNSCPNCKHVLTYEGGCEVCKNCGFSKCS